MSSIVRIRQCPFMKWYQDKYDPSFLERTILNGDLRADPNFKNLSEEEQLKIVREKARKIRLLGPLIG